MKYKLEFGTLRDITTPGLDGVVIQFPYRVITVPDGADRHTFTDHIAVVSISRTLASIWGFETGNVLSNDLIKVMFEFARRRVIADIKDGTLLDKFEISLFTNTAELALPFNPDKISTPASHTEWVEIKDRPATTIEMPSESPSPRSVPPQITGSLRKFLQDHPSASRTAFIIMPFKESAVHNEIHDAIVTTLLQHGITGVRADSKEYHDDVLPNILTYAHGCGFAVAVFERIEDDYFNPNVSLEVGYLMALGKPVCFLKDRTLTALQSDLISKLYKNFDTHDLPNSIAESLDKWLVDRDLSQKTQQVSSIAFSVVYHGPRDNVRQFVRDISKIEVIPFSSASFKDGVQQVDISYKGSTLSESIIQKLADHHALNSGQYIPG